jgi:hypothetical protein
VIARLRCDEWLLYALHVPTERAGDGWNHSVKFAGKTTLAASLTALASVT